MSGYSVKLDDRDELQKIKVAAENHEFDILLVFMFDRIGRRENETPFVLEFLSKHGIEVWSVKEGQQRFDSHEDELINYIRFWAAELESVKTSQRVTTKLRQKVADGGFVGGVLPFGYSWKKSDDYNSRGHQLMKPTIVPEESEIVRMFFRKTVFESVSAASLSKEINAKGVKTHRQNDFTVNTVTRILKNPLYCGYYVRGGIVSPRHEELQIIDDYLFNEAQTILELRSHKKKPESNEQKDVTYQDLFKDIEFCSSCGRKMMFSITSTGYKKLSGGEKQQYNYGRYMCLGSAFKRYECSGQGTVSANKVKKKVIAEMNIYFKRIKTREQIIKLTEKYESKNKTSRNSIYFLKKDLEEQEKKLNELIELIPFCLMGECSYSNSELAEMINKQEEIFQKTKDICEKAKIERKRFLHRKRTVWDRYNEIIELSKKFPEANDEEKFFIVHKLINEVLLGTGEDGKLMVSVRFGDYFSDLINK